jgi:hypothetical protein
LKLKAVVHEAEEGGFWAEIPAMPGCCAQGRTRAELLTNLQEAAEGSLLCGCPDDTPTGAASVAAEDDLTVEIVE